VELGVVAEKLLAVERVVVILAPVGFRALSEKLESTVHGVVSGLLATVNKVLNILVTAISESLIVERLNVVV